MYQEIETKEKPKSENIYSKPIQVVNPLVLPSYSNKVENDENISNLPIQILFDYSEYLPEYNKYSEPVNIFNLQTNEENNVFDEYEEYEAEEHKFLPTYSKNNEHKEYSVDDDVIIDKNSTNTYQENDNEYAYDILPTYTHDHDITDYHEYENPLPTYVIKNNNIEYNPKYEEEYENDILPNYSRQPGQTSEPDTFYIEDKLPTYS